MPVPHAEAGEAGKFQHMKRGGLWPPLLGTAPAGHSQRMVGVLKMAPLQNNAPCQVWRRFLPRKAQSPRGGRMVKGLPRESEGQQHLSDQATSVSKSEVASLHFVAGSGVGEC